MLQECPRTVARFAWKGPMGSHFLPPSLHLPSTSSSLCLIAQLCSSLCDPLDCSPPGSSVHGILQARILEWVTISSSRDLPDPEIEPVSPMSPAFVGGFFTH